MPTYFLGGDIQKVKILNNNGKDEYSYVLSAKTYIGALIPCVEVIVGSFQHHMFPMDPAYHPESDKTDFLSGEEIGFYRMMIGSAMWAVTLGEIRHRPYLFYAEFQNAFYLLIFSWQESFVWDYQVICFILEQDLCV